jgi:hypothetical protein
LEKGAGRTISPRHISNRCQHIFPSLHGRGDVKHLPLENGSLCAGWTRSTIPIRCPSGNREPSSHHEPPYDLCAYFRRHGLRVGNTVHLRQSSCRQIRTNLVLDLPFAASDFIFSPANSPLRFNPKRVRPFTRSPRSDEIYDVNPHLDVPMLTWDGLNCFIPHPVNWFF